MRTIEKTVYLFSELSDSAKQNARDWWRIRFDLCDSWAAEYLDSIMAFCEHFGVTLKDYSVGAWSSIDYKHDADNSNFRGIKLKSVNRGAMPTGFCADCDLWMTFHDEFKRTGAALQSFDSALHAGFKAWRYDLEWQQSDEYIDDLIEMNEYEFTEAGERV